MISQAMSDSLHLQRRQGEGGKGDEASWGTAENRPQGSRLFGTWQERTMMLLVAFVLYILFNLSQQLMNRTIPSTVPAAKSGAIELQPQLLEESAILSSSEHRQEAAEEKKLKNQRWTDREHALYLLFLELNREKIKSKLIRRSNSFYKDMSRFIGNKTGVQCRSHHQKYEVRYKYPHKIIKAEKQKVDPQLYRTLQKQSNCAHALTLQVPTPNDPIDKFSHTSEVNRREVSCQTELSGIDKLLVTYPEASPYQQHQASRLVYEVPHCFSFGPWGGGLPVPYYWHNGLP